MIRRLLSRLRERVLCLMGRHGRGVRVYEIRNVRKTDAEMEGSASATNIYKHERVPTDTLRCPRPGCTATWTRKLPRKNGAK